MKRARLARRRAVVTVLAVTASLLVAASGRPTSALAVAAHPRLLLTSADLPGITARSQTGEGARAWVTLKQRLDAYMDPNNALWYVDETKVAARDADDNNVAGKGNPSNYSSQNQMPTILIDLSFAYLVTGNPAYSGKAIRTLTAVADAGFPFWDDSHQYLGGGDLLRGVALSFDWLYNVMTPAQRTHIVDRLTMPATGKSMTGRSILDLAVIAGPAADPGSNWNGVDSGGAGLALLAIDGEVGAPSYLTSHLQSAQNRTSAYFAQSIGKDGEGGEGYVYFSYGLHNALPFAFALKDSGGADLLAANPGTSHLADYIASILIPAARYDGTVPLNDSVRDALGDEAIEALWKVAPTSSLVSWVWEHTNGQLGLDRYDPTRASPQLPGHNCVDAATNAVVYTVGCGWSIAEELNILFSQHSSVPAVDPVGVLGTAQHFNDHGLVTARTGWGGGVNEVLSTFSAARGAAGHVQQDIGQFTLYGYGGDFAVDSGYGHNYSCGKTTPPAVDGCSTSDWTTRAGQSVGHNLMLVDDAGTTQQGARANTATQTIPEFVESPNLAFAHGDTRTQFPTDPPLAWRDWLFVHAPGRPVVLAIGDQLQRDQLVHAYNWQVHTNAANTVNLRANGFTVVAPSGATMTGLSARNGDLLQSTRSVFEQQAFSGSAFDRPSAHSLLLQLDPTKHDVVNELTVMALTPSGATPPSVSRLEVPGADVVEVSSAGVGQVFLQRLVGSGVTSGLGFTLDGAFGTALDGSGECFLRTGKRLSAYGKDYVLVTGSAASVSVSGGAIQATGAAGNTYQVFAPAAVTSVQVNGIVVAWTRSGNYVRF